MHSKQENNKNEKKIEINWLFWKLYFLMLALPLHASNKILTYLSITGMVSIFHIIIGLILFWMLCSKLSTGRMIVHKRNIMVGLLSANMIIAFIVGVCDSRHIFNNVVGNGIMYFLSVAIVWIIRSDYFKPVDINWFFKLYIQSIDS